MSINISQLSIINCYFFFTDLGESHGRESQEESSSELHCDGSGGSEELYFNVVCGKKR